MDIQRTEYDRAAYEAYCDAVGGKAFGGSELPTWEYLCAHNPVIAKAWRVAANAVVRETIDWYRALLAEQQALMPDEI